MRKGSNLHRVESSLRYFPGFGEQGFNLQILFKMLEHRRVDPLPKREPPRS
jgi:hypothetical protein